ncbi:Purine nucleoside phosphorylase [Mannheimia varigena USDA-ARS-USMARC-1388]|uniref:Purine nucleoside phosphorylase n=1 Tax=Mannheimia varigena USDA-ARS-USMARC-1296 TaxID=1433287 RepID=W0QAC4_9PAST|nr:DUF523 domain-containing protein [Mannheimia varigena]AHG74785.1 Purine nucleoside phosphorylase [Mannheimia varigena USDA-ARS-USMARC-1296]AHG80436.1 Purine nucleoside phosphorylase [Mannheimia varigena USDA-ARS-USMARC-1388]QLB17484.1 purine-nucleoside phosphorylase [Mannheimia varigena]TLU74893.1 DUF523 domain-containing protein [Mannheimia varigena]
MKKVLISACLLGDNVKYSGGNNLSDELIALLKKYDIQLVPICPEILGGLPIPRPPAEIRNGDIVTVTGDSVLAEFRLGAERVLNKAQIEKIQIAILKEKSPSCGSSYIYDGNFTNRLIAGEGITTQLLRANGIEVFSENDLSQLENIFQDKY